MHLEVLRYRTGQEATNGLLFINGQCACYTIEDTRQFEKVPGDTRLPTGCFELRLRKEGGMNRAYSSRFPDMHKGMLWVIGVPGFEWVYIHIGNDEDDTQGCILVGDDPVSITRDAFVSQSTQAYKRIYPGVATALEQGEAVTLSARDYA